MVKETKYFKISDFARTLHPKDPAIIEKDYGIKELWKKGAYVKALKRYRIHYKTTGHAALSEKQLSKIAGYISEQGDETGFAVWASMIIHLYPYSIAQKIYEHIGYEEDAKKLESKIRIEEEKQGELTTQDFEQM